jgi:hypothetical protein
MNQVLQPVDDFINQQAQAILLLQHQLDAIVRPAVFDALEQSPWLLAPGTAANTGSTGSTAVATQGQPGVSCAWFKLAPNGPYADAYWYKKLGADPSKKKFKYELSFLFPTPADSNASQCVELDIQQVISGFGFNLGFQFDFAENLLRVWNRTGKAWVSTGKPCPRWTSGQWMRIIAECHRDEANVYHDAMTMNGNRIDLGGMSFPVAKLNLPDMLNCAVQMDGNKPGTAYTVVVDAVRFTAT